MKIPTLPGAARAGAAGQDGARDGPAGASHERRIVFTGTSHDGEKLIVMTDADLVVELILLNLLSLVVVYLLVIRAPSDRRAGRKPRSTERRHHISHEGGARG